MSHAVAVQTYRNLISEGKVAKGKISFKNDGSKMVCFSLSFRLDRCSLGKIIELGAFRSQQCLWPWGCWAYSGHSCWHIFPSCLWYVLLITLAIYCDSQHWIHFIVNGDYPQRILDTFPASILRRFTDEEMKIIKGSANFFAIGNVPLP